MKINTSLITLITILIIKKKNENANIKIITKKIKNLKSIILNLNPNLKNSI